MAEKWRQRKDRFYGTWRILNMEQWDKEYVDAEGPGFIRIGDDETGEFRFGHVQGTIDYEFVPVPDGVRFDFSWDGADEQEAEHGRGWAEINEEGTLIGKIAFHFGERSAFRARKRRGHRL